MRELTGIQNAAASNLTHSRASSKGSIPKLTLSLSKINLDSTQGGTEKSESKTSLLGEDLNAGQKRKVGGRLSTLEIKPLQLSMISTTQAHARTQSMEEVAHNDLTRSNSAISLDHVPETPYSVVLPYLYLGNDEIPTSDHLLQFCEEHGVTCVINIAKEVITPKRETNNIIFFNFEVQDTPDEDVMGVFTDIADKIEHVKNEGGKIFVHCKAGKSRSAAAVIAYLMIKLRHSYKDAFAFVKQARKEIEPNIGFLVLLMSLDGPVTALPLSGDCDPANKVL